MTLDITNALPEGAILHGPNVTYRIEKTLGAGGFGITYLAIGEVVVGNVPAEVKFAIKEHFPTAACKRSGTKVIVNEDKTDVFKSSLTDFVSEAKKLHSLGSENDNIVKVNEVFEENGTAYYVMQYINGESLSSYVKSKGKLTYAEASALLLPIFNAVEFLHKSNINHLDIKPENIMLHRGVDGLTPVLIDFGLSVHFKKNGGKTSPKGVEGVSEGYSPLEQYAGIKEFNPATDIYALAATLLFSLTGKTPKSASEIRMSDIRTALSDSVPQDVIDGICKAMNKSDEDRTSSISSLKSDLGLVSGGIATQPLYRVRKEKKLPKKFIISAAVVVAVVIIIAIFALRPISTQSIGSESEPIDTIQNHAHAGLSPEIHDSLVDAFDESRDIDKIILRAQKRGYIDVSEKDNIEKYVKKAISLRNAISSYKLEEDNKKMFNWIIKVAKSAELTLKEYGVKDEKVQIPNEDKQESTSNPSSFRPTISEGTLSLGYGTWRGGIRNGKPDGSGTLTFSSQHRVDRSSSYEANPGDYFVATYDNGSLISGKLYDRNGNLLNTIIP